MSTYSEEIEHIFADQRKKKQEQIETALLTSFYRGVPFADLLEYVVIECPTCKRRVAILQDFSEGVHDSQSAECEFCKTEIGLIVEHGFPPVLSVTIVT